jgi:type I restriction enzyme S subunit
VIFAKITPCMENGKAAVAKGLTNSLACGSTEFYVLRADGASVPEYLWRFLRQKSFRDDAQNQMSGAVGQQRVPKQYLEEHQFPLPPLAEQRRVVAKLDVLADRIARARGELDRTILLASNLRAATLRSVFSGELAQSWRRAAVEEILTEGLIGLVRSKEDQQSTGTPYIRMNHYDLEGRWNDDKLTYVSCSEGELRRFSLREGDVLFNTRNSVELVGKVAIWPGSKGTFVYNNNLLRMRFREGILSQFVGRYMMSPLFQGALAQYKSATTSVAAIYQRSLYKLPVPLPPLEEQHEIVTRIELAFARADRLEAEATRGRALLDRLESSILAKAFRGELVPQDPNDEPASVLLDRKSVSEHSEALVSAQSQMCSTARSRCPWQCCAPRHQIGGSPAISGRGSAPCPRSHSQSSQPCLPARWSGSRVPR